MFFKLNEIFKTMHLFMLFPNMKLILKICSNKIAIGNPMPLSNHVTCPQRRIQQCFKHLRRSFHGKFTSKGRHSLDEIDV